ncbi:MAG: hypothetical protein ACOVRN_00470 [Flavobacterium sp.]
MKHQEPQKWPINDSATLVKTPIHYKVQFTSPAYALIQSIVHTHILPGAYTDDQYRTLTFKAHSVRTQMIAPLPIATIGSMLPTLVRQLEYLLRVQKCTIYGIGPADIILINDTIPMFVGSEWVLRLEEDREEEDREEEDREEEDREEVGMVTRPFVSTEAYFSPEVLEIRQLPSSIHYKTAYASLGLWIIVLLVGDDAFYRDYIRHKQLDQCLDLLRTHPVFQTRLYGVLSRCLVEDPTQRCLLLL